MAVDAELEQEVGGDAGAVGFVAGARADVVVAARARGAAAAAAEQLGVALEAGAERGAARQTVGEPGAGGRAADLAGRGDQVAGAGAHAAGEPGDRHPAVVAGGAPELGPRHDHLVEGVVVLEHVVAQARIAGAALVGEAVTELGLADGGIDELAGEAGLAGPRERAGAGQGAGVAVAGARRGGRERQRPVERRRLAAVELLEVGAPAHEVGAEVPRAGEEHRVQGVDVVAVLADEVEAGDGPALVAADAAQIVEPAQERRGRPDHAPPAEVEGGEVRRIEDRVERPVLHAGEAVRRERAGVGGQEPRRDHDRALIDRGQVGLEEGEQLAAQRRLRGQAREVGRVLERRARQAAPALVEDPQDVLGGAAVLVADPGGGADHLVVGLDRLQLRQQVGAQRARGAEPRRRRRRRQSPRRGQRAARAGPGPQQVDDVERERQPARDLRRPVGEPVDEAHLAAAPGDERRAIHAVHDPDQLEAGAGGDQPGRIEVAPPGAHRRSDRAPVRTVAVLLGDAGRDVLARVGHQVAVARARGVELGRRARGAGAEDGAQAQAVRLELHQERRLGEGIRTAPFTAVTPNTLILRLSIKSVLSLSYSIS